MLSEFCISFLYSSRFKVGRNKVSLVNENSVFCLRAVLSKDYASLQNYAKHHNKDDLCIVLQSRNFIVSALSF